MAHFILLRMSKSCLLLKLICHKVTIVQGLFKSWPPCDLALSSNQSNLGIENSDHSTPADFHCWKFRFSL